jgi:hypothetical protein
MQEKRYKKIFGPEVFIFTIVFMGLFVAAGHVMGTANLFNTIMNTGFNLLIDTCFKIMSLAVIAGGIAALFGEFGLVALADKIIAPLMKWLYGLPGASSIGIVTTYLSDNPAILTLSADRGFRKYFKKYQLPALTNLGTAFGMGMIITTYVIGLKSPTGEKFGMAALVGNIGAIIGSIVSTRIMLHFTKKMYGKDEWAEPSEATKITEKRTEREISDGSVASRAMNALLRGGKSGVDLGLSIIPGVLIICTLIMILSNGPSKGGYTGAAYEGVALLPWLGDKIDFILKPLFGFSTSSCIAVPITSLGAAAAAIGLMPQMLMKGTCNAHDIAVFTSMCMCFSGYLSTHIAMMDSMNARELTGKAILSHTIGGICAGIAANWIYQLISFI